MKARLLIEYYNTDLSYVAQVKHGENHPWITARCFPATERMMAIDYVNDMKQIQLNKYDEPSKFPNTILIGE